MRSLLFSWGGMLLFTLMACGPELERVLPRQEGTWTLSSLRYEYIRVNDRIERLDTVNFGRLTFEEEGQAKLYRFDQGSTLLDEWRWDISEAEEIDLSFSQLSFGGEKSFSFQVLENQRNTQLWRTEKSVRVYDVLRRDSVDARILLQMKLDRQE